MEISVLGKGEDDRLEQALAIYRASIVASERKPDSMLREMPGDPRYRFVVAHEASRVIAFAICRIARDKSFWLLEYLAVDAAARSHGLGAKIYLAAKAIVAEAAPGAPCLLEVDQPGPDAPEDDAARKRLRFYRKFGCRRVAGLTYVLPFGWPGEVPPMWLLVDGLQDRDSVPVDIISAWLRGIYTDVYRLRETHPLVDRMLAPLLAGGGEKASAERGGVSAAALVAL